uniref:Uncharacterized protein n=1 Tax=Rhizophora mucronata TaxID=61149 RepID=A0A2P2INW7_RHIMU
MAPITKHHSKKERKSHNCIHTRICFLVFGNPICIYNFLKGRTKFVCAEVCRRRLLCFQNLEYGSNLRIGV